jgi:hypothetical protein
MGKARRTTAFAKVYVWQEARRDTIAHDYAGFLVAQFGNLDQGRS